MLWKASKLTESKPTRLPILTLGGDRVPNEQSDKAHSCTTLADMLMMNDDDRTMTTMTRREKVCRYSSIGTYLEISNKK